MAHVSFLSNIQAVKVGFYLQLDFLICTDNKTLFLDYLNKLQELPFSVPARNYLELSLNGTVASCWFGSLLFPAVPNWASVVAVGRWAQR